MSDLGAMLVLLQYGDSFFPSGAVSFSWGLEGLTSRGAVETEEDVKGFVVGQLDARWAHFDRAIIVAAHLAHANEVAVADIDRLVELQTACEGLRLGSLRMGDAMLSVFARLGFERAAAYRRRIKAGGAHGHCAAMQGFLWAEAGLSEDETIALSAHTFSAALVGAAVRLGCLSHIGAQRILTAAREAAAAAAREPVPPLDEISTFAIEAEIAVMGHPKQGTRQFAS